MTSLKFCSSFFYRATGVTSLKFCSSIYGAIRVISLRCCASFLRSDRGDLAQILF